MNIVHACAWTVLLIALAGFANAGPGEKAYQEMREKGLLYPDQRWQDYVDVVGRRLVQAAGAEESEFHFYVIDESSVNAMAFPDGYIFVHRGLITFLRSEDELAGVIGHEIGHVIGSHARRSNQVGAFGQIAGFIGAILTGTGTVADKKILAAILKVFSFKPADIVKQLKLLRPIYSKSTNYGHFGKDDKDLTWERTDKVAELKKAIK